MCCVIWGRKGVATTSPSHSGVTPIPNLGCRCDGLSFDCHGEQDVLVFQDLFSKWPMVYPMPDQKSKRIVKILVEEIIPFCGVPKALLSDRGTNVLSHLVRDVCELLGTKKLNTTSYHPQCDGLVERYNRIKTALRKHAARFGMLWDRLLSGVLWAYLNTPHESTHEKTSYLSHSRSIQPKLKRKVFRIAPNLVYM